MQENSSRFQWKMSAALLWLLKRCLQTCVVFAASMAGNVCRWEVAGTDSHKKPNWCTKHRLCVSHDVKTQRACKRRTCPRGKHSRVLDACNRDLSGSRGGFAGSNVACVCHSLAQAIADVQKKLCVCVCVCVCVCMYD